MSVKEREIKYTPTQNFFRKMRDTLCVVYEKELMGSIRLSTAEWEATKTVDIIATYYDELFSLEDQEKLRLFSQFQPNHFKLRGIALAVSIKQNEMKEVVRKDKSKQKGFFSEDILTEDNLLVLEAIYLIDQYLNRA